MRFIFALLVVGALGYELVALVNRQPGDTISEIVWRASRRPLLPFALGMVMGHFVWQRAPDDKSVRGSATRTAMR